MKDNIENFGGDPTKITIFGQSAGAVNINYLLLTNLTKGIFEHAVNVTFCKNQEF